jgi:hypothetical protein
MALNAVNAIHALQIQAGALGRKAGHLFEDTISLRINQYQYPIRFLPRPNVHVLTGDPALLLLGSVASHYGITHVAKALAISTGALATSEEGQKWLTINGSSISRCKSDLVITIEAENGQTITTGISTKQCNNKTCTNAQLYFTTARAFVGLLRNNGIPVSNAAMRALRQFCGDAGFRPLDDPAILADRQIDPRRFFWEELNLAATKEWEGICSKHQDQISRLLFQKGYINDPFIPDFLLHKTKRASAWENTEVAIYSIDELIKLSRDYQGFVTKPYTVRKGRYKDPLGVTHLAPRFGIIQMQRGGQQQHPEQLQFNLETGYFYRI